MAASSLRDVAEQGWPLSSVTIELLRGPAHQLHRGVIH